MWYLIVSIPDFCTLTYFTKKELVALLNLSSWCLVGWLSGSSARCRGVYPFKNIFDFTTAGDWNCVAAVERLPVLHYSVDFIFLSFGIIGFIVELRNY